jgi:two-component system LytT family sensor kinase
VKKHVIIALHIAYWLCYILLLAVIVMLIFMQLQLRQKGFQEQHVWLIQLFSVMTIFPAVLSFYTAYVVLMPRFLAQKKMLLLSAAGLGGAVLSAMITSALLSLFFGQHYETLRGFIEQMVLPMFLSLIHGVLGLILKGFVQWFEENRIKSALLEQNLTMELALIKAQLDPHFLFNTLNNIDVLIEQDSKRASEYLQKLSAIMRFMLYETKSATMPLFTEIAYVEKYLDLQKIRTSNPDFVRFEVLGDAGAWNLASMLFLPFIENAFKFAPHTKHGAAITIRFQIEPQSLVFECNNRCSSIVTHSAEHSATHGGLGKSLIERRLQLLYPTTHHLEISTTEDMYNVHLKLTKLRNKS